jgi:hypothetical protein
VIVVNRQWDLQQGLPITAGPPANSVQVDIDFMNATDAKAVVLLGPQRIVLLGSNSILGPRRTPNLGWSLL